MQRAWRGGQLSHSQGCAHAHAHATRALCRGRVETLVGPEQPVVGARAQHWARAGGAAIPQAQSVWHRYDRIVIQSGLLRFGGGRPTIDMSMSMSMSMCVAFSPVPFGRERGVLRRADEIMGDPDANIAVNGSTADRPSSRYVDTSDQVLHSHCVPFCSTCGARNLGIARTIHFLTIK